MSRCCDNKRPYDQECYRLSTPSAGTGNTCNIRRPFYLEEAVNPMIPGMDDDENDVYEEGPVSASRLANIDDHTYAKVLNQDLSNRLQRPQAPTEAPAIVPDEAMEVDEEEDVMFGVRVPYHQFDADKLRQCRDYLPTTKMHEINTPAITQWLEIIKTPGQCRFRCYQCSFFLKEGFRPELKNSLTVRDGRLFVIEG